MRIAGNLETSSELRERRAERFQTDISAGVRERGRSGMPIEVVDLSTHGCRIEFEGALIVGAHAWLTLPSLESRHARVAWMVEGEAGLDFVEPLHPIVAQSLLEITPEGPAAA
jgi:PilZ domain